MKIDILRYLDDKHLTIYRVAKESGYGYTTLHKSFNKQQSNATSINLRDLSTRSPGPSTWRCGRFCVSWRMIISAMTMMTKLNTKVGLTAEQVLLF